MAKKSSMDGFVPRRSTTRNIGEHHIGFEKTAPSKPPKIQSALKKTDSSDVYASRSALAPSQKGLTRNDIDESLNKIEDEKYNQPEEKKFRPRVTSFKPEKKPKKSRRWAKRAAIIIGVLLLAIVGWFGVKTIIASGNIFNGDIFGFIQKKELKMDENGRTNILVFGTSEDDPGHDGAHLTDSMMIVSLDQNAKNAYMISIPRDLYVDFGGKLCFEGSRGKINGYYSCLSDDYESKEIEQQKLVEMQSFIGDIFDLNLQYSVHLNYSVVRDLVDAVGGITVNIEGTNGAPGVMDSNFDWKCRGGNEYASRATMVNNCPPNGHFIDYPNGPAKLDGEHALYLAQARGANGNAYGLDGSNFAREQNQQKIMVALKDKAFSTGTLADFGKVTGILDALGANLRTNFQTAEIRTLLSLGDMESESIKSIDLYDKDKPVVQTGPIGNQSVVLPVAGLYNYSEIQRLIRKTINASPLAAEEAGIVVLNGSGVPGAAATQAEELEKLGLAILQTSNAPTGDYENTRIYKIGESTKTLTADKLKQIYSVELLTTNPPVAVSEDVDFVIIIGMNTANSTD